MTRTLPVVDTPTGLAATPGAVWVVGSNPTEPVGDRQADRPAVQHRRPTGDADRQRRARRARLGWRRSGAPSGSRRPRACSPDSTRARDASVQAIDPNAGPTAVAVGAGAVWVADSDAEHRHARRPHRAADADPGRSRPERDRGRRGRRLGGGLARRRRRPHRPEHAGRDDDDPGRAGPAGIAVGAGSVWVANSGDGTVTRIDPDGARSRETIQVGGSPQSVVVAGGRVWVTVDQQTIATTSRRAPGGTVRLSAQADVDSMDPALAFDPNLMAAPRRRPARSSSTTRTSPPRPAPSSSPRSPSRCRNGRPTARPTRSRSARGSASRRPRTSRSPRRRSSTRSSGASARR